MDIAADLIAAANVNQSDQQCTSLLAHCVLTGLLLWWRVVLCFVSGLDRRTGIKKGFTRVLNGSESG